MRLTNSARQEAGLFQNIQTVPLCWNGAESLLAVAAGSRGHLTASPAMVTGAVAEMPSTLPPAVRVIGPHLAPCPRPAKGSWHAATHGAPSRAVRGNVSQAPHRVLETSTWIFRACFRSITFQQDFRPESYGDPSSCRIPVLQISEISRNSAVSKQSPV